MGVQCQTAVPDCESFVFDSSSHIAQFPNTSMAGNYTFSVRLRNAELELSSILMLNTYPSFLSISESTIDFGYNLSEAGRVNSFWVSPKDGFSNIRDPILYSEFEQEMGTDTVQIDLALAQRANETTCTGTSTLFQTCDLDASTDDTDTCPTGCTNVAASAATTCANTDADGNSTPATDGTSTCDLDALTDSTADCPAGCTNDEVVASCTGTSTAVAFDVALGPCAAGYAGEPAATACTAAGSYSLSGCAPFSCTQPADITGYYVSNDDLRAATFDITPVCLDGYLGTPAVAVCSAAGAYTLLGCIDFAGSCQQPVDLTGYTVDKTAADYSLTAAAFRVTASCAAGYAGTAVVTGCTSAGDYQLSGCAPFSCTPPADTAGYVVTNDDLRAATFDVTAACAKGFAGAASAACTAGGAYTLAGCAAVVCTQPADTTGYTLTGSPSLDAATFSVMAECDTANGYTGAATATACAASGEYTLTGCTAFAGDCTAPADTAGYVVAESSLAAQTFAVTASCAAGYAGAALAAVCTAAGPYGLSGCAAVAAVDCTTPVDTRGYAVTERNLALLQTCDLDASTDGTDTCPTSCANVAASAATTCTGTDAAGLATPATDGTSTCDLDISTDGTADCPAGCTTDGVVASCTETSTVNLRCDFDASTDGTAVCPAGCAVGALTDGNRAVTADDAEPAVVEWEPRAGSYLVSFVARRAGEYAVTISMASSLPPQNVLTELPGNPFLLQILPGALDPTRTAVDVPPVTIVAGVPTQVNITAFDVYDNVRFDNDTLRAVVDPIAATNLSWGFVGERYEISLKAVISIEYLLQVDLGGFSVTGSPYTIGVRQAGVDLSQCEVVGCSTGCLTMPNILQSVNVIIRDKYRNIRDDLDNIVVQFPDLRCLDDTCASHSVNWNDDGAYNVTFRFSSPTDFSYTIDILVNTETLASMDYHYAFHSNLNASMCDEAECYRALSAIQFVDGWAGHDACRESGCLFRAAGWETLTMSIDDATLGLYSISNLVPSLSIEQRCVEGLSSQYYWKGDNYCSTSSTGSSTQHPYVRNDDDQEFLIDFNIERPGLYTLSLTLLVQDHNSIIWTATAVDIEVQPGLPSPQHTTLTYHSSSLTSDTATPLAPSTFLFELQVLDDKDNPQFGLEEVLVELRLQAELSKKVYAAGTPRISAGANDLDEIAPGSSSAEHTPYDMTLLGSQSGASVLFNITILTQGVYELHVWVCSGQHLEHCNSTQPAISRASPLIFTVCQENSLIVSFQSADDARGFIEGDRLQECLCDTGYFGDPGGYPRSCLPCDAGTYTQDYGAGACAECDAGTSCDCNAFYSKRACDRNKNEAACSQCQTCGAGQYQDEEGQVRKSIRSNIALSVSSNTALTALHGNRKLARDALKGLTVHWLR
jgi:hypothetical protein